MRSGEVRQSSVWLRSTRQLWKFRLLLVIAVMETVSAFTYLSTRNQQLHGACLIALFITLPILAWLVFTIRCRVCDEFVLVWAAKRGDWINRMEKLTACPNCGALTDDDKLY